MMVRTLSLLLVSAVITLSGSDGASAFGMQEGKRLYEKHCMSCHGSDGRPQFPPTPDFSRGEGLFKTDKELFDATMNGKLSMPGYRGILSENEVLDIISYIRTFIH